MPRSAISASVRAMTRRPCPAAGGARRLDLALEFRDPDQLLPGAGEEARVLREGLVLDHDGRRPGPRIGADDMPDIDRVAVAGVEIGDQRDADLLDDRAGHVEVLGERQEARVGHAIGRRQFEAARPDAVEPGLFGEPRRKGLCADITVTSGRRLFSLSAGLPSFPRKPHAATVRRTIRAASASPSMPRTAAIRPAASTKGAP